MIQDLDVTAVYDRVLATQIAGGSAEIAAELLALLLKELPEQRAALKRAFASDDAQAVWEINHKLYGSARYCGAPALTAATQNLESALQQASLQNAAAAFNQVIREINRLLQLKLSEDHYD